MIKLKLDFKEKPVTFRNIEQEQSKYKIKYCSEEQRKWWEKTKPGESFAKNHPKGSWFNSYKANKNKILPTVAGASRAGAGGIYHYAEPRHLHIEEYSLASSFPLDYNYLQYKNPVYFFGMSVPPLMTYKIAREVIKQIFKKEVKSNFIYKWKLSDLEQVQKNGVKVFSCFSCGGGSTMGYKMAGCDVIGCNEIDPEMMVVYKENHNPKYTYLESISDFKKRKDLPDKLYNLDILDGSPPCSSFSMSGNREKNWGQKKKFREGQQKQILDNLFFDYIDVAAKLKPKIIIAENVKGMLMGKAKGYVKEILARFKTIGYYVQLFLLNGANMGLPQKRERVFFICQKID